MTERDGAIAQVRGDPEHPVSRGKLCRKCTIGYNGAFLDPAGAADPAAAPDRPEGRGPLRAASPGTRRSPRSPVALRRDRRDARARARSSTRTTPARSRCSPTHFGLRFFNRLGATEVEPDTICNKAGHVALDYVYGTSMTGFDPRTARDAACILVWGANPSASAPHAHEHWLPEAPGADHRRRPGPDARPPSAADLHLQPFPGSDAALAFALLHVIVRDGLADRALARRPRRRLGRARAAARAVHAGLGRGRRPASPRR